MSNASGNLSLEAAVSTGTAHLGDLIMLSIQATHPPGPSVVPTIPKELGTFEVFASTTLPSETNGPVEIQRFQMALQNFTTGQQVLPGIDFSYMGADHKPHVLKSGELKILIQMVPPGPKDQGDIRGIKAVLGPSAMSPWWWLLLAFAILIGGICLWKERRRKTQGPPPEPLISPDQTALDKLRELLASGWLESGKIKEFYIGVSDTVRTYIETGFKCPALERTTGELMRDIRKRALFDSAQILLLKQLLEEGDLVKFAKFRPDSNEALKMHAQAVQFVEVTTADLKRKQEKDA